MGVIDPNVMYRAGLARGHKGRNIKVERQIRRRERLINFAYETIGKVATTAVHDGYKSFQKFRDQLDSPMAASLTQIDKLPKENAGLRQTIQTISDNYRKANRKAHLSFGKKRRAAKAERQKWMTQMTDLNAALETYKVNAGKAQGMARVFTGVAGENNKGGNVNLNPGNQDFWNLNTAEMASGEMAQLLRWNMDGGYMEVARNGSWVDGQYRDKNIENNKELKKKYDTYKKGFESKQKNAQDGVYPSDADPGGLANATIPSYQEWASTQDQSSITYKKYSDLRFGDGEDNAMEQLLTKTKSDMITGAKGENALDWSEVDAAGKLAFTGKINSFGDAAFRDFYFGGYSYDYSSNRMDETAPAYQLLLSRDLTPYSEEWQGALTTLKAQSMVKGSVFRQTVAEDQWNLMKDEYTKSRQKWLDKQAEKQQKIDNKYYAQNREKYYSMALTDDGGAQSILKSQVDPIVNVFNTAKDDGIVPQQSVPYLSNIQFGKDKKGWYTIVNEMGYSDPNNRNTYGVIGTRRIDGTKDEIAALIKINSPQLGYQFTGKKTPTPANIDYNNDGTNDLFPYRPIEFEDFKPDYKIGDGSSAKEPIKAEEGIRPVKGKYYLLDSGKIRMFDGKRYVK